MQPIIAVMEYTYIVIDSNAVSNLQLENYLDEYGDFMSYGIAKSNLEGLNLILKHLPDVVFLNLGDNTAESFQMVAELHQYLNEIPVLIAISNNKEHAYDAIKNNFFDYWLLPYNEFDIRKSLLRLKKQMPKEEETTQTLCLKSYTDFRYIDTDEILYLKADNNATDFIMKDGTVVSAFKTLKTFENKLPDNFVRVHQSFILNINYVSRVNYGKSFCILKYKKTRLPFSKSYKENIEGLKKKLAKSTISTLN
ncbi:MAG: LytTR family DNA-binding domain-containing protein [Cellulophaga sp.]